MKGTPEQPKKGPAVLFVCTANVCRSPMAAALFRALLKKEYPQFQNWQVGSAGTWAQNGLPASRNARQVMAERGLDISSHRSRMVSAELLERCDIILTMEEGHKEALCVEFPSIVNKVYLLSEMEGEKEPVEDPFGGSLESYQKTADIIDQILAKGVPRIIALASEEKK